MTQDILSKGGNPSRKNNEPKTKKHRISFVAVVLGIMLAIVLIILGERALFDLNRSFNPLAVTEDERQELRRTDLSALNQLSTDESAVTSQRVYYGRAQTNQYKLNRMLVHSAFVIPVFLLMFVIYFYIWYKKEDSPLKVVVVGYLVFAFWMMLHLLSEVGVFVLEEYKNIGVYLVLLFLAAIFTMLMVVLQHRVNRHS